MKLSRFICIASAMCTMGATLAQDISLKPTEVVPGLTMLEGEGGFAGGNMALLTGEDGVVLIDDGLENLSSMLLASIRQHTEEPVDFVINTHVHGDHVGANMALHMQGATIVSHDNIRKRLADTGWQTMDGKRPAQPGELPTLTFSDAMTFHLNGRMAFVFHVPAAHTDGDSMIHFPGINVIHTGDVFFNGIFPYIDLDSGGSVAGYLAAQRRVLELADDETKILPGHGPLATKADMQAAMDMLVDADSRVKALVEAGKTEQEVVQDNPLADYHDKWNWGFITTERMTRTLYRSNTYK